MTIAASVTSNSFLRRWVAPAEATVRTQVPHVILTQDVAGWRRGAMRGAHVGWQVGSALTLPVDVLAGTLHGSARIEVKATHKRLQKETGGELTPLSNKQRFLLRLEDGLLGNVYVGALRGGAYLGAAVGTAIGAVVSSTAWVLRAAGWSVKRLWAGATADKRHPRPMPVMPDPIDAWQSGVATGERVGKSLGAFTCGVGFGLVSLAVTLTSAGAKGLFMAAGAVVGGIAGLGDDAQAAWRCDDTLFETASGHVLIA